MAGLPLRRIDFFDKELGSPDQHERVGNGSLELVASTMTAGDIITARVTAEWTAFEARQDQVPGSRATMIQRLVQDADVGRFANLEAATEAALDAFKRGSFLFFWNERQVENLDERLDVLGQNEVLFVRLLPLKGG